MSVIFGFLSLICFLLLFLKLLTRALRLENTDRRFMKLHKPASGLFLIFCLVHVICAVSKIRSHVAGMWILGLSAVILFVVLTCCCHMIKDRSLNIRLHRLFSVLMLAAVAGHFVLYYR
ncbi:MAG: hypothetical protein V8R80_11815 [Eubacterium sp.]